MPRPKRRASAGEPRRRRRPPTSTVPASGARKPLAMPSNVDFPDPFSPTSACTSPARQSKLTSRSACTAPNAFETPLSERTTGLSGPGIDISSSLRFLLRVHPVEQAQRNQRGRGCFLRIPLRALVSLGLVLKLDREHDLRWDLRALQLHERSRESHADLRIAGRVVEDPQVLVLQPVVRAAHAD